MAEDLWTPEPDANGGVAHVRTSSARSGAAIVRAEAAVPPVTAETRTHPFTGAHQAVRGPARLRAGAVRAPPDGTGEAADLPPAGLTLTFGFGHGTLADPDVHLGSTSSV